MTWTRAMDEKFEMLLAMMKEMKAGQEEMRSGQERLKQEIRSGEEEIKDLIQAHVKSQTQFNVISSTNGWTDLIKVSQLVASLRGSAAEVLQGIPPERLTDQVTIENALESRFGDSHLIQFYRTELKTRRQKPGESLKVLAADVERLMSLAYAECPLDVRESLAAQYFVDAIRDGDTQHSTRLMDAKDLKSALVYSMKYEVARTMSKTCSHVRSMEIEDNRVENEVINFNLYLTGWKNYLTVVLLERGTLLDETRT
ncbi:hypothetical protein AVEN_158334-1 [Araneus ventricosus]|uniref:Uncharacterized protein n=1 Tax=Araneus ventricosus TaxID=182803 RepID=A0A4Y2MUB3_ARAVE|nr:hypothetical protein AVEN_65759-1 [Araneus ventricosus]GBN29216.1 hypothetical protein AVEN_158334-1 [Araneus ventricosus]